MTRKQEEALQFQNAGVGRWRTVVFCLHWGVGNGTGYPVEQMTAGRTAGDDKIWSEFITKIVQKSCLCQCRPYDSHIAIDHFYTSPLPS
jgi:hypothetical protein